jgi:iron complex outermembrane receptor protein
MKQKNKFTKEITTFNHWLHKPWAVFGSIGKVIRIGMLPTAYFLCLTFTADAQTDTVQIENVEIVSTRVPTLISESARVIFSVEKEEIQIMPVQSLQEVLDYFGGIDVRQRGNEGMQADIGINGGSFDQSLILLNGFKMNDVQTGHHNLNLPIDLENVERIEILEGPGNRIFGVNAYSGAVNFITNSDKPEFLKLNFIAGQYGYYGFNSTVSVKGKQFRHQLSISGQKCSGYLPKETINNTDFKNLSLFYETVLKTKLADFSIQSGYNNKSFGANSFYTPVYPYQFENTKTIYIGYKAATKGKYRHILHTLYWRRHQDRFELFRESQYNRVGNFFVADHDTAKFYEGIYADWNYYKGHNYHLSHVLASELKYDFIGSLGKTAIGAEFNHAFIRSNVLGIETGEVVDVPFEPYGSYTKEADRSNINFYLEHVLSYKRLMLGGGFSSNYNSEFAWNLSGGIDFSIDLNPRYKIFASVNRAVRLPTYTDLYYDGPVNKGNPELLPEYAISYEMGVKYNSESLNFRANVFRRDGKNTIDWVKLPDSAEWQAQNITELTTYGAGLSGFYTFDRNFFLKRIGFSYSWLDVHKESGEYYSKYVLDHLKHKGVLSVRHDLFKGFSMSWFLRIEDREGTYLEYDRVLKSYTNEREYRPYILTDVKLLYRLGIFSFFVDINNLLNTDYVDYANVEMPGIWIKAGIGLKIK